MITAQTAAQIGPIALPRTTVTIAIETTAMTVTTVIVAMTDATIAALVVNTPKPRPRSKLAPMRASCSSLTGLFH